MADDSADQNNKIKTPAVANTTQFETLAYASDERTLDGFVRSIVDVRGLKTSKHLVRKGFLPSFVRKTDNAEVDGTFEESSLCLTVRGLKGEMKNQNLQLKINKLIHDIDGDNSYYECEDDRILLFLKKKNDVSWQPELRTGLEQKVEESEGEKMEVTEGETKD